MASHAQAAITISAARVWPAPEYTRITLESNKPIHYEQFTLENPDRLVIDLKGVEINGILNELASNVHSDDPYIKSVRVARFKPGIARLVFDLKSQVKPQLFNLMLMAKYSHRMVLDIYPAIPFDPMMALLQEKPVIRTLESDPATVSQLRQQTESNSKSSRQPEVTARTLIVAIDAGHGGEDSGVR